MTDQRDDEPAAQPGPPAEPERGGPLGSIEGTDQASLGLTPPAGLEPSAASVDPTDTPSPAAWDERPATESKPWYTSLTYREPGVGVESPPGGEKEPEGRPQG
jgi:hypothetical protein